VAEHTHPPLILIFYFLIIFNFEVISMPYFVNICGEIKCRSPDSIECCTKVLKRYRLAHKINEQIITINSRLHVTELFDEDGFKNHLLTTFRRHGNANLLIDEVETDETTDGLLR
jgi:hypothetical protein